MKELVLIMESNKKILHYEVIEHTDLNEEDSKYSEKMWKHRNPNWKQPFIPPAGKIK